jgi:hypothetical protein
MLREGQFCAHGFCLVVACMCAVAGLRPAGQL